MLSLQSRRDHIFFECSYVEEFWARVFFKYNISEQVSSWDLELASVYKTSFVVSQEIRNSRWHDSKQSSVQDILQAILFIDKFGLQKSIIRQN